MFTFFIGSATRFDVIEVVGCLQHANLPLHVTTSRKEMANEALALLHINIFKFEGVQLTLKI